MLEALYSEIRRWYDAVLVWQAREKDWHEPGGAPTPPPNAVDTANISDSPFMLVGHPVEVTRYVTAGRQLAVERASGGGYRPRVKSLRADFQPYAANPQGEAPPYPPTTSAPAQLRAATSGERADQGMTPAAGSGETGGSGNGTNPPKSVEFRLRRLVVVPEPAESGPSRDRGEFVRMLLCPPVRCRTS